MAVGDVGLFLPSEGQYRNPGAYRESLRAQAVARGTYLSEMDRFYAMLERRREEQMSQEEMYYAGLEQSDEHFHAQIASTEGMHSSNLAYQYAALEQQENLANAELGLAEEAYSGQMELWEEYMEMAQGGLDDLGDYDPMEAYMEAYGGGGGYDPSEYYVTPGGAQHIVEAGGIEAFEPASRRRRY